MHTPPEIRAPITNKSAMIRLVGETPCFGGEIRRLNHTVRTLDNEDLLELLIYNSHDFFLDYNSHDFVDHEALRLLLQRKSVCSEEMKQFT